MFSGLQSKEYHKKLLKTYKPIPELEKQLAKEYKVENSTVSVLELDSDILAETNFLIGENKVYLFFWLLFMYPENP